jgi:quercetin dioxygenase-like cupin family protein
VKIIHYTEAEAKTYPSDQAKEAAGRVVIGRSDGAEKFCMRVFEIGRGGMTGLHAHDWEHEVFVHSGEGAVLRGETWVPLSAGSVVFIKANEQHQLKNTGNNPFAFVCVIPSGAPEL